MQLINLALCDGDKTIMCDGAGCQTSRIRARVKGVWIIVLIGCQNQGYKIYLVSCGAPVNLRPC